MCVNLKKMINLYIMSKIVIGMSKKCPLKQLDERLSKLEKGRSNFVFNLDDIKTKLDIQNIKKVFDKHGVIFLLNATNNEDEIKQDIQDKTLEMFGHKIPKNILPKIKKNFSNFDCFRNVKTGFGTAGFGYLFAQPRSKDDSPKIKIDKDELLMTENTGYQVNLNLLEKNKHTMAVLFALTHPDNSMISFDSVKYSENPKKRPDTMIKQYLTPCHFDAYGVQNEKNYGTDRIQAIISFEDNIKLGYVPDSIDSRVKDLIVEATNKHDLYQSSGFKTIKDQLLIDVLNKYIVAPPSNSLVIWKSGIFHYEAEFSEKDEIQNYHKYKSLKHLKDNLRMRCIVGTHKPVGLSQTYLKTLAKFAECGFVPEVYNGYNKNTKFFKNLMASKSTQYFQWRKMLPEEKTKFDKAESTTDVIVDNLSKLRQFMYGLNIDVDDLELDDYDKQLLK
jgi:hypothetical protein